MQYYTEEEMSSALLRATTTINNLTTASAEYTRGINDCFALMAEYELELTGQCKVRELVKFRWKSTRDFMVKLARAGYNIEQYMEYCGCEIISSKRPQLGDISFENGAMINDGDFWVSTDEDNNGVRPKRQAHFLERQLPVLARPIRS